jgi:drug/metabolite transporter (DMT)-like permease
VTLADIALLVAFSGLMSGGQILFKQTALTLPRAPLAEVLPALLTNAWFYAAVTVYALSAVVWVLILRRLPLSLAYPFVALAFLIVPLAAAFLWGERLRVSYGIGAALVVAGIAVLAIGSAEP